MKKTKGWAKEARLASVGKGSWTNDSVCKDDPCHCVSAVRLESK